MQEDLNKQKDTMKDMLILILIVILLYLLSTHIWQIRDASIEASTGNINIFEITVVNGNLNDCCLYNCTCKNSCTCNSSSSNESGEDNSGENLGDNLNDDSPEKEDNPNVNKQDDNKSDEQKPNINQSGDNKTNQEDEKNPTESESGDNKSEDANQDIESEDKCDCNSSGGSSGAINKDEKDDMVVYDEDVVYSIDTPLNIFTHSANHIYNGKIAPGSENSYNFYIKNANDFDIKYNLYITEENNFNVNMKYKLKLEEEYIAGSENEYVSVQELNQTGIVLKEDNIKSYTLEWKWVESDKDTEVGTNLEANYKLYLKVIAEQY